MNLKPNDYVLVFLSSLLFIVIVGLLYEIPQLLTAPTMSARLCLEKRKYR